MCPATNRWFPIRRIVLVVFAVLPVAFTPPRAEATSYLDGIGFEDDVDLVVAPTGEFLVVPEESAAGAGQIRIMDLDPLTGAPIALRYTAVVPGWERGVDPVILPEVLPGEGWVVLAPVESADGAISGVFVLHVNAAGAVLASTRIETGNLGFREDVDITWTHYIDPVVAFVALESRDHLVRGVLAIDCDPRDITDAPGVGACTLLSTDGRGGPGITRSVLVDWLPGLAPGVDPVSYEIVDASRMALPVTGALGSDLLLIDFDPNDVVSPLWMRHFSSKARNAGSARPTNFPGFERDVDLRLFNGECGLGPNHMLVPVEGPGDVADIYLLDSDGFSIRTLSVDGFTGTHPPFLGFEKGVDLLPMCGLGGLHPSRVAIPLENSAGTDADLWMADLTTLQVLARAENPAVNPGLAIEGWEVGIDLQPWAMPYLVAPTETLSGKGRLRSFDIDLVMQDSEEFTASAGDWGFRESVDPIVADVPAPPFRTLFVPIDNRVTSDSDVMMYPAPPTFDGVSLEALNPGTAFGLFEWDVDLGLSKKQSPGGAYIYLPEEGTAGSRVRFELTPGVPSALMLAVATERRVTLLPALRFFNTETGLLIASFVNVNGLENGLDMANGRGSITPSDPPLFSTPPGYDADSDPTPTWALASVGMGGEGGTSPRLDGSLFAVTPSAPPIEIRFARGDVAPAEIAIIDAAGRRVRILASEDMGGDELRLTWDGRDESGARAAPGIYFVEVRSARGILASKIVLVR